MVYQRPTKASLQKWADEVGDQSYSWDQFLPYFEKSITFTPANMHKRSANSTPEYDVSVMGFGDGPLSVTYPNYIQAFGTWVTKGLEAIGLPVIPGFQSGTLMGQSYTMFTLNATTMTRDSSETSFLRRALAYPNYIVYTSTMGKKILFDDDKNAIGVEVDTLGTPYTLTAKREVIISGGAFASPQLLMVSGIGPASALQELNIPMVADRPGVGRNMQDHVYYGASYPVNAPTFSSLSDPAFAAEAARQYNEEQAGMYTDPTTDTIGWEKVPAKLRGRMSDATLAALATYPADWPELEYLSAAGYLGLQTNLAKAEGAPKDGRQYASMAIGLITPQSRGDVTLVSSDNAVLPVINPNFLTDRADVEVAVAGFKRMREFWQSEAVKPFLVGEEVFPGMGVETDAQIEDVLRRSFNTIYHAACTCAMGRANDSMAVVDSQARVFGVQRLRVVDASSFPFLTPGHPQSVVCESCLSGSDTGASANDSSIDALAEKIACAISGLC